MEVERRVFLEMSPVIFERYLTHEEIDGFRRREQRLVPVGLYLVLPAVLVIFAFVGSDYGIFHKGVGFFLAIAGLATLAIGVLRIRDLVLERRILRAVGIGSKVLTFRNLGYWPPISHVLPLDPPDTVDMLFPERLVIACDNKPLKTFNPIALTIFEDLPWPERTDEFRELNPLECEEVDRRLRSVRTNVWAAGGGVAITVLFLLSVASRWLGGDFPGIVEVVAGPLGLWYLGSDLKEALRLSRILRRAKTNGCVNVTWDGDLFREYLLPDQLIWRDETGPARWRRVSGKEGPTRLTQ